MEQCNVMRPQPNARDIIVSVGKYRSLKIEIKMKIFSIWVCAFPHTCPSAWNSLPEDIRAISDFADLRRQLKTHY